MWNTGIIRRLDDSYRISLPKNICRKIGLKPFDPIAIDADDNSIILQKYKTKYKTKIEPDGDIYVLEYKFAITDSNDNVTTDSIIQLFSTFEKGRTAFFKLMQSEIENLELKNVQITSTNVTADIPDDYMLFSNFTSDGQHYFGFGSREHWEKSYTSIRLIKKSVK